MKTMLMKILAAITFVAMVVVNYLANLLPINNRTTGAISDAYPNLFAPAGLTFAIWGLIYLLLGIYVVFQFTKKGKQKDSLLNKINPLFITTSLINIAWIFAWHYDVIWLSVMLIASLLVCLILIAERLRTEKFSGWEKLCIATPFFVYFGWLTVANIANITVFLVSLGWNGFGIADYVWTSIIIVIGAIIGILRMRRDRQVAYGLVLIWAYLGIWLKHFSSTGFDGAYPSIMVTVLLCVGGLAWYTGSLLCGKCCKSK